MNENMICLDMNSLNVWADWWDEQEHPSRANEIRKIINSGTCDRVAACCYNAYIKTNDDETQIIKPHPQPCKDEWSGYTPRYSYNRWYHSKLSTFEEFMEMLHRTNFIDPLHCSFITCSIDTNWPC